jgi:hypothetical protein
MALSWPILDYSSLVKLLGLLNRDFRFQSAGFLACIGPSMHPIRSRWLGLAVPLSVKTALMQRKHLPKK